MKTTAEVSALKKIVYTLFFVSGASSLIYEVIWVKLFSLVFGNTTFAVSAVLASFFAGLALGSWLLGHFSDRYRGRYLLLYGILELSIGLYALILPKLISTIQFVYLPLIAKESLGFPELTAIRFVLAFGLMILPSTLMGATLPILSKFFVEEKRTLGISVGRLYALNTWGAAAGCLLTGFLFMAVLGVSKTNLLAVLLNTIVGATAFFLSRREVGRVMPDLSGGEKIHHTPLSYLLLAVFGLSGLTALGYEVIWVRILAVVFGPTAYSFSIMLTAFLSGIALGSLAMARGVDRLKNPLIVLGLIELAIGGVAMGMIPFFKQIPPWFLQMSLQPDISWHGLIALKVGIAFLILLPPTILFGATFPLVGRLYPRAVEKVGGDIGNIYAVNTVGGIFGSTLAGFVLLPLLGVKGGILVLALVNAGIGILLVLSEPDHPRKRVMAISGAALTGVLLFFFAGFHWIPGQRGPIGEILYYREDAAASVLVEKRAEKVKLWVNGRNEGGITLGSIELERKFGHLPLLLHPGPRRVLAVGLGTGISAGAISRHPVERVDVVEIVPSLVETSRYFTGGRDLRNDPRYRFIIGDGRNFMVTPGEKYDVIVSDIYQPDVAGTGNLYALEYYTAVKNRLNEGGIFAQWLTLYQMTPEEFQSIVATLRQVFPSMTVWIPLFFQPEPIALVVGGEEDLMLDLSRIRGRVLQPGVAGDLLERDDVLSLLSSYITDERGLGEFLRGAVLNTDDHPYIEYAAPKNLMLRDGKWLALRNIERLTPLTQPILPHLSGGDTSLKEEILKYQQVRRHLYQGEIAGGHGDEDGRLAAYLRAEAIDVNDLFLNIAVRKTHKELYARFTEEGDLLSAEKHRESYEAISGINPFDDAQVYAFRARHLASEGRIEEAEKLLRKVGHLRKGGGPIRN
ncbi:MAG: fused MFS/spermidine synthase [Nitrospirae bacterium]|nr:fused MFS/spermidine synthase [Nitrospirota bacterium]